jgi:alpha-glucosidase
MKKKIKKIMKLKLFGIKIMGEDICGLNGKKNEDICQRWSQLGEF